jgi:hypothetical protein
MCNPTVLRYSNEQLIQTVIISLILDQIQRSNYCALRCAALRMLRWNVSGVLVALTIQQLPSSATTFDLDETCASLHHHRTIQDSRPKTENRKPETERAPAELSHTLDTGLLDHTDGRSQAVIRE